ncbi:MAG: peptidylprolyl isomerase [bacterium]|nr:peptidylprolyl isomerase [bacterium]
MMKCCRFAPLLALVGLLATRLDAEPELLDRIAAVIDDEVVLWSELNLRTQLDLQEQGRNPMFLAEEVLVRERQRVITEMIDELVVVKKAEKDSVEVDSGILQEHLDAEFGRIKANIGESELTLMLERSGMTERQLKQRYRKQIRHRLLYEQMVNDLAYRQFITRRDVEAFRDSFAMSLPPKLSISQINVKVTPEAGVIEGAQAQIAMIQLQLEGGQDFASVARQFSEDPGTSAEGGNLGCFAPGTLMPEFERAAFNLKPGEVSEPVLTSFGFHLILLNEKRETEMCASHILVRARTAEADHERARALLEDLRRRAVAGEDFAQLARDYSQDPGTARQGGLWQIIEREAVPPFLAPYVADLGLGSISQPFFLEDGGHILKVNDDFATLESLVREERVGARMAAMIADYRSAIHVEERLDRKWLWDPESVEQTSSPQRPAMGRP